MTDKANDQIRMNSLGCAALDDIISHSHNLLSAMDARIRLAQATDRNAVNSALLAGEEHHGPTDSHESYWKHEREVLQRIIHQARFARGHETS